MNPLKPISISLSPNTEKDDIFLTFKLLFQPWRWKKQGDGESLEKEFKKYLGIKHTFSFNSGRSALMAILSSLELEKEGDEVFPLRGLPSSSPSAKASVSEVLLQAFTCNAAANPILWAGSLRPGLISRPALGYASLGRLKPVYVDCDEKTFNIDIKDLRKKITSKSRAVMIQHTFGLSAEIKEVLKICKEHNLILIEDCAHSLGAEYENKKVGSFGKVAFFSFSRDKVVSSVYGGMAVTNDDGLAGKIKEFQEKIEHPSFCWIFQQLLHPILMNWLILPVYSIFGKYFLILLQHLKILSKAVHWKEKKGLKPDYFPKKMPNALAVLALNQFKKLEKFNRHRIEIAQFYRQELENTLFELPEEKDQIYLRFTVKHSKAHQIIEKAWHNNLLIGDWYTNPIAPDDTKLEKMGYIMGCCPKAEKLAKKTLNLPTHINISKSDAQKVAEFLKRWKEK